MRPDPMHMSAAIRVSRLSRSCRTGAGAAVVRVVRHRMSEDGQPGSGSSRADTVPTWLAQVPTIWQSIRALSGSKVHDLAGAWNTR